jgi:hypothetical protein
MDNLYVGNDNDIKVNGVQSASTGVYVDNAILTAQVYDKNGSAVGSPVTLSYVANSNGNYLGTLPASTPLVADHKYLIVCTASNIGFETTLTRYAQTRST